MGMFDTVMVEETKCPICHKYVDYVTYFLSFEPKTEKTAKYRFKEGKAVVVKNEEMI